MKNYFLYVFISLFLFSLSSCKDDQDVVAVLELGLENADFYKEEMCIRDSFPAYAIGWMVSSEKWFEPLTKVVNDLKLKASYGKVGNDDISDIEDGEAAAVHVEFIGPARTIRAKNGTVVTNVSITSSILRAMPIPLSLMPTA